MCGANCLASAEVRSRKERHMFGFGKTIVAATVVAAAGLLAGCQDTGGHRHEMQGSGNLSEKAVMCTKCQVTYFQTPAAKGSPMKYQASKMECPDCKSAADNFF